MTNTRKDVLKAAFDNVDSEVYDKAIQEWTDDVMNTFGEYLLRIYSEERTESNRRFYCGPKVEAEILDYFQDAHASYYLQCLELLETESEWDDGDDDGAEVDPGDELQEYILSCLTSDVAEEAMQRLEKQLAENAADEIWNAYINRDKHDYAEQVRESAAESMDYYGDELVEICANCPMDYCLPDRIIQKIHDKIEEWFLDKDTEQCAADLLCRLGVLDEAEEWDNKFSAGKYDVSEMAEEITLQFITDITACIVEKLESQRESASA